MLLCTCVASDLWQPSVTAGTSTGARLYTDECADLEAHRLLNENPSVEGRMASCALLLREALEASDTVQATALILLFFIVYWKLVIRPRF